MGTFIVSQSLSTHNKIIAWLTGILTLLLASFSFVLSFNALTDLAANHGITIPILFPLVVEAGVIIFSLNALYRSLHSENTRWQWCLIIGSSLLAGTFNVLHAEPVLISQVMSAMPSLFLLLSFETFLGQIKHAVKRSNLVQSILRLNTQRQELDRLVENKQQELDTLTAEANQLNTQIEQAKTTLSQLQQEIATAERVQSSSIVHAQGIKAEQDAVTIEQRRQALVDILRSEEQVGPSALAERLNTSRTTVYNDLNALCKEGVIYKNGDGWEVVQ
ncbi:MAG: DUF2637 domain-containing protein [Anaerolineae bacterium]|nr:DUF2637 domain-containing protein [Anaerolineae bacterium]